MTTLQTANPIPGMEMTPLPIPSAEPVKVEPARPPEPYPAQAGYAGKAGQGANIISNFLMGMAAGKAYREQADAKKAQTEVTNAQAQWKFINDQANDINAPKEKREAAAKLLPGAWNDMIAAYQKYVGPSEEEQKGKSKLRKVGERLTRGLREEKPQLISHEQFETLKQMGPMMSIPSGPSAQQKEEQLRLQSLETQQKRMDTAMGELDEANKAIKEGALRDPDKRQKVLEQLTIAQNTLGNVSPKDLPDPLKEAYDRVKTQADTATAQLQGQLAGDGLKAYQKKQKGEQLSAGEQQTLDLFLPQSKPPDPMTIFMNLKGKDYTDANGRTRRIDTDLDAYNAFLDNEAANARRQKQADFDAQQQPVKDALRAQWRLMHGGQEPTKDELNNAWLNLYGTTGTTKAGDETKKIYPETVQRDAAQTAMNSVRGMYEGKWGKFFMDRNATTDKSGKVAHHGAPDFIMRSRNDFNVEDQKEWDKAAQELGHELQDRGFTLDQISTIVGREAVERMMTMTPTPGGAGGGGKKKVKISAYNPQTKKTETQEVELTADPAAIKKEFEQGGWQNVTVTVQ